MKSMMNCRCATQYNKWRQGLGMRAQPMVGRQDGPSI